MNRSGRNNKLQLEKRISRGARTENSRSARDDSSAYINDSVARSNETTPLSSRMSVRDLKKKDFSLRSK